MDTETRPSAENQADKKIVVLEVLLDKCTGTVKWYSHKLLYGFISRGDNNEDVFVHRSAITASNSKSPNLRNGEEVEFSVVRTNSGIEACNVTGPAGDPVQGFTLNRRRRRVRRSGPNPDGEGSNADAEDSSDKKPEASSKTEGGTRVPRRRPRRRGPGNQNGEMNGNHSEGEVYYEPGENGASPKAGQQRLNRPKPTESGDRGFSGAPRRGRGSRGGRGGIGYRRGGGVAGTRGAKRGGASTNAGEAAVANS